MFGYMCADCNYLQIDKKRLMKHLTEQHDYKSTKIHKNCEKVTLIPDLSHIKTSIKYKYIEPDTLFKCTVCNAPSVSLEALEKHIDEEHVEIDEYICCCRKKLSFGKNMTGLDHLHDHSADIYRCMCCDDKDETIFYRLKSILNHICNEHTKGVWTFQHIQRQSGEQTIVSVFRSNKYVCNVCNQEFDQMIRALKHFKTSHSHQSTNIKTIVSHKRTQFGNKMADTKTNYIANHSGYALRQGFLCNNCDNCESRSKEELLAHHNSFHPFAMFEMKPGSTILIQLEQNAAEDGKMNEEFDRFMAYSCYKCYEKDDNTRFIDGTAKSVYDHWSNEHRAEGHPFRFHIESLVQCGYCDLISTYKGMLDHIKEKHPKLSICFVNVNAKDKCPLCNHSCDLSDLAAHFKSEHRILIETNMDIVNPNRLTEEQFQQLLNIDVYKKLMCNHCDELFDSDDQYNAHHELKHRDETKRVLNVVDKSQKFLLTTCCNAYLAPPQDYFEHLNKHNFEFSCQKCNLKECELEKVAHHDMIVHNMKDSLETRCASMNLTLRKMFYRTKHFYGNGMVLYKHNLLGTKQDDMEVFEHFLCVKNQQHTQRFNEFLENTNNPS